MHSIVQLKLLINLAFMDGEVADREKKYITNIGIANGLSTGEITPLFSQQHDIIIPENLDEDIKFGYVFSLVQLMKIDEKLYRDEIRYCANVAAKLGYDHQVMFELMINVRPTLMNDSDVQALKTLTRKYLS